MNIIIILLIIVCLFLVYSSEKNIENTCVKAGCSGQLCLDKDALYIDTCEWKPEYSCYKDAMCTKIDGVCQWVKDDSLMSCLKINKFVI